jgi:flagellar hook-associated protein 1
MSLSSALSIAQSSIKNTARRTSVVSRNVLEADNMDYSRRSAVLSSTAPGARVVEIHRATNEQLFRQNMQALSSFSGQRAVFSGMDRLGLSVNGVENGTSPAIAIGKLQEALQLYSTSPSNHNLGENTLDAARQVVRSLRDGTIAIQTFRIETDQEIATAVDELNTLLADFEHANRLVIAGTRAGRDVSDALDQRDAALKRIAEYVPVSTFTRGDNDMVLMTKDGATLFETVPRAVNFTPSTAYAAGVPGNTIYIDGVPVALAAGGAEASGKLAGLVKLRDGVATTMQSQLDEVARGLIMAFAETDPANAQPKLTGLFTWSGGPNMPPPGTLINGLAGSISLNPAIDSTQPGSNPLFLRDGGANGTDYIHNDINNGGGVSYSKLLIAYADRIDTTMAFDPSTGINASTSLSAYSTAAIGWFERIRKEAYSASESKEALAVRTAEALSNDTGVNVDMEMSLLLDLEHSYEASARLIKAVDDMLASLFAAVR